MANEFKVKKGLIVDGSGTVLDVQGTEGQLFSVTDSLTGDLFSVSDVSGVPIFNVNSSGLSTFDGDVSFGDGDKLYLGASNDLGIYHDGSHSYLDEAGTGDFRIRSNSAIALLSDSNEDMVLAIPNGAVNLYYNNSKKFETTTTGATFTSKLLQTAHSTAVSNSSYNSEAAVVAQATNTTNVYPGFGFHKAGQLGVFLYATSRSRLKQRGDNGNDYDILNSGDGVVVTTGSQTWSGQKTLTNKFSVTTPDGGDGNNDYIASFVNQEATDGANFGITLNAGSTSGDIALNITDHDASNILFRLGGHGYAGIGIAPTNNQRLTLAEADSNGSHIKMNNSRSGGGYWVNGVGDSGSSSSITPAGGIFWYNGATRMVIDSSGNAGIGVSNPEARLEVAGGSGLIVDVTNNTFGGLKIDDDSSGDYNVYFRQGRGGTNSGFRWYRNARPNSGGAWGTGTHMMSLTTTGLGIGTTTPNEKFVVGTTGGTQNIEIGNNFIQSFNRSASAGYASLDFYASSYAFNNGDVTVKGSLIGKSDHTTELGSYADGQIKRIRMSQGGEVIFGDSSTANPIGVTEGVWNSFGDQDYMSIYSRNSFRIYGYGTSATPQLHTFVGRHTSSGGSFLGVGNITSPNGTYGTSNTILTVKGTTSGGEGIVQIVGLGNNATDNVGCLAFHSYAEADPMASIRSIRGNADDKGSLSFNTNNGGTEAEVMRITNDKKIGINTGDPDADLQIITSGSSDQDGILKIGGSGTSLGLVIDYDQASATVAKITSNPTYTNSGALMKLCVDGDANANQLVLKGDGKVGINTAAPSAQLEIVTAVGADAIRMNYGQSADIFLGFNSTNPRILLQDNNNIVTHDFSSNNDNYILGSSLGIGISSPASNLHVKTSVDNSVTQGLIIERSANSDRGYINYQGGGFQFRSTVGDPIVFGETDAEHVRIIPDGNVGISTTSPSAKLEVAGDVIIDGTSLSDGDTVFDVQGDDGQLFSVTNSLTGDLFSVADVSGVPILNVNSSGAVEIDGTFKVEETSTFKGDVEIHNEGNDTTGKLTLAGNNNTGTPGVKTSGTIEHRGADLKTVITHNGSDVITVGTGTQTTFAGTVTADPGVAGTKAIKAVGTYASNGDVKLLEFVRTGDAVAGAIEYNDATTDMEIGTVTNHAFSIKTNDTRAISINNSQKATFSGAVHVKGEFAVIGSNGNSNNRLKATYNGTSGLAEIGPHSIGGNTELRIGTSNSGTYATALTISNTGAATFAGGIFATSGSVGSQLYALELTRSGSGTSAVDMWGNSNTLVLGHNASVPVITINSTATTFAGTIYLPQYIQHTGDTNTNINFESSQITIATSGGSHIQINNDENIYFRTNGTNRFKMDTSGNFTATADLIAFGTVSDKSFKENIKPINNALDLVNNLQGVTFDWKQDTDTNKIVGVKEDIGFIAQDVQKVLPELVRKNDNGKLSLREKGIVPVLVEAIKELKSEIEELKKQIK